LFSLVIRENTQYEEGVTVKATSEGELFGARAIQNVVSALPLVPRAYATIRFSIMRPKLLAVLDLLLPHEGRILDVGCGFGLFAGYFGQMQRARTIVGIDPDESRIGQAKDVARALGHSHHEFYVGTAERGLPAGTFDAAYVLDVMHHLAETEQVAVLESLVARLRPGGLLVMKDVTTEPYSQLLFTEILDRAMIGMKAPLHYRHHQEWQRILDNMGLNTRVVRVPDILPYPHVVLTARKK
jgi:2-polyprenyl-3-methyl-5-hydroxy-6-metoxy-1,4-benzoquinol methylase